MQQDQGLSNEQRARIAEWAAYRDLPLVVLFGSRARGKARPDSDFDFAIWRDSDGDARERLRWYSELEDIVGADVDIAVGPSFDPVLGWEIAQQGDPVFERTAGSWARERLRLWHLYNDSLPFRRVRRKLLADFAAEVRRGA